MINVTVANFETEVITASNSIPILIDFWTPASAASQSLSPILEALELAYAGRFKLAKIDAEQEPRLVTAFGIRSVPTCVLMLNGQPADGFTGGLTEDLIKAFLDKHLPPAPAEKEEEAEPEAALSPDAVLEKMKQTVAAEPANDDARFELVRLLLQRDQLDDAKVAFAPVIAQTISVRRFDSLQRWMDAIDFADAHADEQANGNENAHESAYKNAQAESTIAVFDAKLALNKRDFETRFDKARWLMSRQQWSAALDELLEILMRDKSWHEDSARKTYIAILDVMEAPKPKVADGHIPLEDPQVATYRRRLSSVILS
jgi:putative thioredoxin